LPFSFGKGSRAALGGVIREQEGVARECRGASRECRGVPGEYGGLVKGVVKV